jgi:hypothetical protein
MGEGWSDYMALMVTTNWATAAVGDGANKRPIGTYVVSQAATGGGIRTYPYSTNMTIDPWTYGMMATNTSGEVHTIGEIWCAAVWDMTWNIIQQEGIDPDIYHGTKGNNIALQLVLQGMKYQPCSPGFLDGRDAILKADSILYNYAHKWPSGTLLHAGAWAKAHRREVLAVIRTRCRLLICRPDWVWQIQSARLLL